MTDLLLRRLREQLARAERIGDLAAITMLKARIQVENATRVRKALVH